MFKKLLKLIGITAVVAGVGAVCYNKQAEKEGLTFQEKLDNDTAKVKARAEQEKAYLRELLDELEDDFEEVAEKVDKGVQAGLAHTKEVVSDLEVSVEDLDI